mmetsp:Transcript_8180/g.22997  ORF Transcript_8180/g.22997 Transcript_8180/m.22997 type:complete len:216 (-) Transcript_8180:122-769(-)
MVSAAANPDLRKAYSSEGCAALIDPSGIRVEGGAVLDGELVGMGGRASCARSLPCTSLSPPDTCPGDVAALQVLAVLMQLRSPSRSPQQLEQELEWQGSDSFWVTMSSMTLEAQESMMLSCRASTLITKSLHPAAPLTCSPTRASSWRADLPSSCSSSAVFPASSLSTAPSSAASSSSPWPVPSKSDFQNVEGSCSAAPPACGKTSACFDAASEG